MKKLMFALLLLVTAVLPRENQAQDVLIPITFDYSGDDRVQIVSPFTVNNPVICDTQLGQNNVNIQFDITQFNNNGNPITFPVSYEGRKQFIYVYSTPELLSGQAPNPPTVNINPSNDVYLYYENGIWNNFNP